MHKINVSELKPGMVVIDPKLSWIISPYLYTVAGPINSEDAVDKISAEGFLEVYIQDERDKDAAPQPATAEPRPVSALPKAISALPAIKKNAFIPPPPQVELSEELPRAKALYEESLQFVGKTLNAYREGSELPLKEAAPLMDAMLESVTRNDNAFLVLSKLRSRDEYTYTHSINVAFLSMAFARQLGLGDDLVHRLDHGGAADRQRPAAVGAHAKGHAAGIAVHDINGIDTDPQTGCHQLGKGGFVALAVAVGPGEDGDAAGGVNTDFTAFEQAGPGAQGTCDVAGSQAAGFDVA